MANGAAFLVLAVAALLEAAGDAIVRAGLGATAGWLRPGLILLGGVMLLGYGIVVNTPPWDLGRLLGVYVCLFFLVAQGINWTVFHIAPGLPILVGGALIVSGGLMMTFWH